MEVFIQFRKPLHLFLYIPEKLELKIDRWTKKYKRTIMLHDKHSILLARQQTVKKCYLYTLRCLHLPVAVGIVRECFQLSLFTPQQFLVFFSFSDNPKTEFFSLFCFLLPVSFILNRSCGDNSLHLGIAV